MAISPTEPKIEPPFTVGGSGFTIVDANGVKVVMTTMPCPPEFPQALCKIMNENADFLCESANYIFPTKFIS